MKFPKICALATCQKAFDAKWACQDGKRIYCSQDCAKRSRKGGPPPEKALAARKAKADARLQVEVEKIFGPLTEREIALARFYGDIKYSLGFCRARNAKSVRGVAA